jgi:hypothetical protein
MKKMQEKSKRYKCTRKITTSPSNQVIGMVNTKPPHKEAKPEELRGLVKMLASCLSMSINIISLSLLNMVTQKVVSHSYVFGSPMENRVMG